jgi:hypothetical protein
LQPACKHRDGPTLVATIGVGRVSWKRSFARQLSAREAVSETIGFGAPR